MGGVGVGTFKNAKIKEEITGFAQPPRRQKHDYAKLN
jgi:hypothetical protein